MASYASWVEVVYKNVHVPIFTGNPGGNFRVTKSRSRAKWELVRAMRSMIGVTCSTRDRGCSSLIHSVPLNLHERKVDFLIKRTHSFKLSWCDTIGAVELRFLLLCPDAQFNGPADVSVPQVKIRVEVFFWRDGCGIGGSGILQSQVLVSGALMLNQLPRGNKNILQDKWILPLAHLCAALLCRAETPICSFHLRKQEI